MNSLIQQLGQRRGLCVAAIAAACTVSIAYRALKVAVQGQLSNPRSCSCILNWIVGRELARRNEPAIAFVAKLAAVSQRDHVLEIGFGPGNFIAKFHDITTAPVHGFELSLPMLHQTATRFYSEIASGRLFLTLGNFDRGVRMPYPSSTFSCVVTINCVYFWSDLRGCLREILRVTAPGGRVLIHMNAKSAAKLKESQGEFLNVDPVLVSGLMSEVGYVDVSRMEAESDELMARGTLVIVGHKADV